MFPVQSGFLQILKPYVSSTNLYLSLNQETFTGDVELY